MKDCCQPGEGRTRNLLITSQARIQMSHRGRQWNEYVSKKGNLKLQDFDSLSKGRQPLKQKQIPGLNGIYSEIKAPTWNRFRADSFSSKYFPWRKERNASKRGGGGG